MFPFDTQVVCLELREDRNGVVLDIVNTKFILTCSAVLKNQWLVLDPEVYTDKLSFDIQYMILIKRRYDYYIYQIQCPILIMFLFNFSVFFIEMDDLATRISILITILLTMMAFNFSILSLIPKTSYLTIMNVNILLDEILISAICVWSIIIKLVLIKRLDNMFGLAVLYIWFIKTTFLNIMGKRYWDSIKGLKDITEIDEITTYNYKTKGYFTHK